MACEHVAARALLPAARADMPACQRGRARRRAANAPPLAHGRSMAMTPARRRGATRKAPIKRAWTIKAGTHLAARLVLLGVARARRLRRHNLCHRGGQQHGAELLRAREALLLGRRRHRRGVGGGLRGGRERGLHAPLGERGQGHGAVAERPVEHRAAQVVLGGAGRDVRHVVEGWAVVLNEAASVPWGPSLQERGPYTER